MKSYTTRDVARLVGLSEAQVRSQARVGYLSPDRGPSNAYRFSFQDLVLLRTAKALSDAHVAPRRIRGALRTLTRQLPAGRPLSGLRISFDGDRVVVRDGTERWHPESGQLLLDLLVADLDRRNQPRDPRLAAARVALGRWLQDDGHPELAMVEYRAALASDPVHPTAAFHLGTALESLNRTVEALAAYRRALRTDDGLADAHLGLARVYGRLGKRAAARRHLEAGARARG